jgi:hypothetical protein
VLLAVGVAVLLVHFGSFALRRLGRARESPTPAVAEPAAAATLVTSAAAPPPPTWLEEVDALARSGAQGEAVQRLFRRALAILATGSGADVPSRTSREVLGKLALPGDDRRLLAAILAVVERHRFGDRPVDAEAYGVCRAGFLRLVGDER